MQNAETVLNVIRERGERGLPLENIYRLLYNRNLYLRAYGHIASNQGATTKGTTAETVDGMSLAKIDRLIEELRYERFRWTPVRRVNIAKPNGGTRPLGIPTWTDKMLQEVGPLPGAWRECGVDLSLLRYQPPDVLQVEATVQSQGFHELGREEP